MELTGPRYSGILCHITSLPTSYGVGDFGPVAYEFIDHLCESHQYYWQILPIGNTSDTGCPYATDSAFGSADYYVSPELLIKEFGFESQEFNSFIFNSEKVDFKKIQENKLKMLEIAYKKFTPNEKYEKFLETESAWIKPYCLFRTLKETRGYDWTKWPAFKDAEALMFPDERTRYEFHLFSQYICFTQLADLKKYANSKGVKLVGDLPIFVSYHSMDVWKDPSQFFLNKETLAMEYETGAAPDGFSATGQKWGTPIYDWEFQKKTEYKWWNERLSFLKRYFDVIRIDHFRGFCATWISEVTAPDASGGKWYPGPGADLFNHLHDYPEVIAEDLGYITQDVYELRDQFNFPGMKVFEFLMGDSSNPHKLENYTYNSVAYSGTHDCDTLMGWYKSLTPVERQEVDNELKLDGPGQWDFLKILYHTPAKIVLVQIQDLLGLGTEARFNYPGTVADTNWTWKMNFKDLKAIKWHKLADLTVESQRSELLRSTCG
ncbi:MAG: 4-alpha-glucanotransferase [Rhizobacter sp.]|nr:4-alpha-glucanotransferase [Bacteriovorax sp.]